MAKHERKHVRDYAGPPVLKAAEESSELYYRDAGHGDVVLMLHNFPLSSRMWEQQITALQSRVRLVAPDFPGFGQSPALPTVSFAEYATDIGALLDELDVNRVTVVALGEGTYVALHLVDGLGSRLRGLLLAGPNLKLDSSEWRSRLKNLVAEVLLDGSLARFAVRSSSSAERTTN